MEIIKADKFEELEDDIWFLPDAQAVVEFYKAPIDIDTPRQANNFDNYVPWGQNNLQPVEHLQLIYNNNLKPQLLKTERNFLVGQGVMTYVKKYNSDNKIVKEPVITPPEIQDFLDQTEFNLYLWESALDFVIHGNAFTQMLLSKGGQVYRFYSQDAVNYRLGEADPSTGKRKNIFKSNAWGKYSATDDPTPLNAFDEENPTKFASSIMHIKEYISGFPNYSPPFWWGSRNWTKLSNQIPLWHIAGLKNGYTIRYHVKFPNAYFDKFGDKAEEKKLEMKINMNKFLSGEENAGKAFVSTFSYDSLGKAVDGVQIEPVDTKLHDEAFTKLFEQSNQAHTSAHGISPALAGIQTQGQLSSGSEIRSYMQFYQAIHTFVPREILLRPLYIAKKINGWDKNIMFGIEDISVTNLDQNPIGTQSSAQTTNQKP